MKPEVMNEEISVVADATACSPRRGCGHLLDQLLLTANACDRSGCKETAAAVRAEIADLLFENSVKP